MAARAAQRDEAIKLVAMIRGDLPNGKTEGAAIVFGVGDDRIYLVTSDHVVRTDDGVATNIRVQLRTPPGEMLPAELLPHHDGALDVAVLVIKNVEERRISASGFPFSLLGEPERLESGDEIFSVGKAGGVAWWSNAAPDVVSQPSNPHFYFQSPLVSHGQSGGGVFDADWLLVGLVVGEGDTGSVKATRIDAVLDFLARHNYPIQLQADPSTLESCSTTTSDFDTPEPRLPNQSGGYYGTDQHAFSINVGRQGSGDKRCVDCDGIVARSYRISATVWEKDAMSAGVYLLDAENTWYAFEIETGGRASIKRYSGVRPTVLWTGAYKGQQKNRLTLEARDGKLLASIDGSVVGEADYDRRWARNRAFGAGLVLTSGSRVPAIAWFDDYELVTCGPKAGR